MTDRMIVITGASSGIGAELAKQLAFRGNHLMLAARNSGNLRQVARACGRNTLSFTTDVTNRTDVNRLRDESIRAFGHVDVWINNVGRGIVRNVLDLTDEDFAEMIGVNLRSALLGMQASVPHFKERQKGHLINVSSFPGRVPFAPFGSIYNAAKSALNSLTSDLRMDLQSEYPNIHISLVLPGITSTEFFANALYSESIPKGEWTPSGAQTPEQVANVIVELIENPKAEVYTNPPVQLESEQANP